MFDFTSFYQAENAAKIYETKGPPSCLSGGEQFS